MAGVTIDIPQIDIFHFVSPCSRLVRLHDQSSLCMDHCRALCGTRHPLCSLGLPALIASYWGDARGGFLVAGALRCFIVQHFTFFVNSVWRTARCTVRPTPTPLTRARTASARA